MDPNNKTVPCLYELPWAIHGDGFEIVSHAADKSGAIEAILARPGIQMSDADRVTIRGRVAIVEMIGPILHYGGGLMAWLFGWPSTEGMMLDIQAAEDNPAVDTIVLHIYSPGGQVGGIAELAGHIRSHITKPVVAYVGDMAASAAYWLASAADRIVAAPTAEIGSIGVVFTMRRRSDNSIEIVSSVSPKKRVDPETDEGRQAIQARADALADVFVSQVAENRNLSADQVTSIGGDVVIAAAAVKMGLADEVGSLEQVIAGLNEQPYMKGDSTMDLAQLQADHPDLYAQVMDAGRAEGREEMEARVTEAENAATLAQSNTLDMVTAVLGNDARGRMDEVMDAGMTADQVQTAQKLFGTAPAAPADDARQAILDGITTTTPDPAAGVDPDTTPDDFMALVTAYEAENKCKRSQAMAAIAASHPESYETWLADQQKQ